MGRGKNIGGISAGNWENFKVNALRKQFTHNEMITRLLELYDEYNDQYEEKLKSEKKVEEESE